MAVIPFHFQVNLNAYPNERTAWLCIFSQPLLGTKYYQELIELKRMSEPIRLRFTSTQPSLSSHFTCFIYVQRVTKENQQYITRCGFVTVSLGDVEQGTELDITDIRGFQVGTLKAFVEPDPATGNALHAPGDFQIMDDSDEEHKDSSASLDDLLELTEKALQKKGLLWGSRSNITDDLPHSMFVAVQQHCGKVPMWTFPLLNFATDVPTEAYFEQALFNAKYLLMNDKAVDFKDRLLVGELLNEIQTLPVRTQLYVFDTSKRQWGADESVDDWINPLLSPIQGLVGLDCEDAVQRMLQEGIWLAQMSESKNQELATIARIEQQNYISFLVAMSLKMPDGSWVYHAAGLKLDRNYVFHKLGLSLQSPETRWPAVLLEGTAYTTGCWEYTSVVGSARADKILDASSLTFSGGIEAICKVTPRIMANKNLYGPMQSLFSPELAQKYGIVQIELAEGGKRAAQARSIMNYSASVEWHPIRLDFPKDALQKFKDENYPLCPVPQAPLTTQRPLIKLRKDAQVDFCLRSVDYNEKLQKELEDAFGKKIHVTQLHLAADLGLLHVSG